jgi:SAM-dependent methyltransferase
LSSQATFAEAHELAALAVKYANDGELAAARDSLAQAVRLVPSKANWWAAYGRVLMRVGDEAGAARCLRRALVLKPDHVGWKIGLSELLRRRWGGTAGRGLDLSAEFYDAGFRMTEKYQTSGDDSVYRPVWELVLTALSAHQAKIVLDLGCGPGQFAEFILARSTVKYFGYDFSPEAVQRARNRTLERATFDTADLTMRPLPFPEIYDTVVATEFLEHVTEDLAIIRALHPGTRLIASVPNFDSFGHVRFFGAEEAVRARYRHVVDAMVISTVAVGKQSKIFVMTGNIVAQEKNAP